MTGLIHPVVFIKSQISGILQDYQKEKDLTLKAFAKLCNVSNSAFEGYVIGKRIPSQEIAQRIGAVIGKEILSIQDLANAKKGFAGQLRDFLQRNGMSRLTFAKTLDLDFSSVQHYSKGISFPKDETYQKIVRFMQEHEDSFFPFQEDCEKPFCQGYRAFKTEFGRDLKKCQKDSGLSVKEFAERIGVRPITIYHYFAGKFIPNDRTIEKIEKFTGLFCKVQFKCGTLWEDLKKQIIPYLKEHCLSPEDFALKIGVPGNLMRRYCENKLFYISIEAEILIDHILLWKDWDVSAPLAIEDDLPISSAVATTRCETLSKNGHGFSKEEELLTDVELDLYTRDILPEPDMDDVLHFFD